MRKDELLGLLEGGVGGISQDGVNEEEKISVLENYGCTVCVVIYCGEDSIVEYCMFSY